MSLRKILKGNVGVMTASWILFGIGSSLTRPYFSLYVKALGGSDIHIAIIRSISGLAALPLIIPGGYLTDALGRKRIIIPLTWTVAVLTFAYALAPDWTTLLMVSVIDSLLHFYSPALHAIIVDSLPPEIRARGVMITSIIPSIPWLIFPPIGGWLIDNYGVKGFRIAYILNGITAISAALLRTKFLMETINKKESPTKTSISKVITKSYIDTFKVLKKTAREVRYIIIGSIILSGLSTSAYYMYAVVYASEKLGISREMWGWYTTIGTLLSMTITTLMLPYLDKVPRKGLIATSYILFILSIFSLTYVGKDGAIISVISSSISNTISFPAWQTYMGDIIQKEYRGRVDALTSISMEIGMLWGNMITGYLYSINSILAFQVSMAICIVETAFWLIVLKEPKEKHL